MCWPEADKYWDKFLTAHETFQKEIRELVIFKQPSRQKYIKLYDTDENGRQVLVYLQRQTHNIVKVVVNYSTDGKQYGTQVVTVYADDADLQEKLLNLPCVREIATNIEETREIMYADQIIGKLTYG